MHARLPGHKRGLEPVLPDAGWRRNRIVVRVKREATFVSSAYAEFHPASQRSARGSCRRPLLRCARKEARPELPRCFQSSLSALLPGRIGQVWSFREKHVLFDASNYLDARNKKLYVQ